MRLLAIVSDFRMRFALLYSAFAPTLARWKSYSVHSGRGQTERAHDKLNTGQMKWKRTTKNHTTTKINWFIFYWSQRALVFTTTYARKFLFTKWNREQATSARSPKYVLIVLCALAHSTFAHTATMTNGHHSDPSQIANLLFMPHSHRLTLSSSILLSLALCICICRPRYETLKLNYYCQSPKYNICPTDG